MIIAIDGPAGTGKSTLITHAISALGLNSEDVAYAAFTGKAAEVLRKKNCPNACTLHHLLYNSTKDKEGKFIFAKKTTLEGNFKLFVVDEVSMVPNYIWDLLLSHKIFVIACGDPFQLPPVEKDKGINTLILYPVYEAISVAVTTIFKINKNKSINAPNMAEVDDINNIRFYINGLVEAEEFIETDNFFGLFYDGSIHSAEFIEGGQ